VPPIAKSIKVSARSKAADGFGTNFMLARLIKADTMISPAAHRTVRSGQVSAASGITVVGLLIERWFAARVFLVLIRTFAPVVKFARLDI